MTDEQSGANELNAKLGQLLALLNERSQPNLNNLHAIAKDLDLLKLTVKNFGYEIARKLTSQCPIPQITKSRYVGLKSKACTQADLESDWAAHWLKELKSARIFHRKLWEFAYLLQQLHDNGLLQTGMRGLGFGCGAEPIPSYLAAQCIDVTVTDLPPDDARAASWGNTNQLTKSLENVFHSDLVDRSLFDRHVGLAYVDMTNIPSDLAGYDFCWSICALEHLGSIKKGLEFIENSVRTLKKGGVAIHTTEFNFLDDNHTIDNWPTVLFQRRHFIEIAQRLTEQGCTVAEFDFDVGSRPMDKFIDIPPFIHDWRPEARGQWGDGHDHLKVAVDGFASTCFGITIKRVD